MENKLNNQACPTCQSSSNSFVAGAAIGAVLGAVLGLMLSPASGELNRRNLVKAAGNTKKAQEAADSAVARKVWLAEAEKNLAEFS